MQTIKIFNYPIKIWPLFVSDLSLVDREWRKMYSRPIKIFRGVNNPIKLWALNTDQKPINISNLAIQCSIFTPDTEYEWFSVAATNVDGANGVASVTFVPSELAGLQLGMYEIGMTATDVNSGEVTPVYLNDNYQGRLEFILERGPVSQLTDPIPVSYTDTSPVGVVSNYIDLTARPAGNSVLTYNANLTVPYTGNIIAQASQITNPVNGDFGNVTIKYYNNFSGETMFNVLGTYATMRFVIDALDPGGRNANINPNNYITSSTVRY